jgi:tetratricopeptide (TPR) repeat protein
MLLPLAYQSKGDTAGQHAALRQLCQAYLKTRQTEPAFHTYLDDLDAGGKRNELPPALWLDLARAGEGLGDYDRALPEFEQLAAARPAEPQGLQAHLGAARILMKVGGPQKALAHYEAAQASAVPHLDLEPTIAAGIRAARKATGA